MPHLWLLVALFLFTACRSEDKVALQKAAVEARRAEIFSQVDEVLRAWLDHMVRTLPSDLKKYPKVKSPLVEWRTKVMEYDWKRPLKTVVARGLNTPFRDELQAIPTFFEAMERFWRKEIDFKDYMEAWKAVKDKVKDRLVQSLADFDHTFVHLEAFYGAQDMEGDDRAIYFFRHWQVAFDFPRELSESVSDYLARLCKERLQGTCNDIPFEFMHFAMERPYLERAREITKKFMEDYPDFPLNRVFDTYLSDLEKRLQTLPTFKEDPILPNSKSKKAYVGDIKVVVRKGEIEYEGQKFKVFQDNWTVKPSLWSKMVSAIAASQKALEEERGPENLEVLLIAMDKEAPVSIASDLVAIFKEHPARIATFGARRRMEGIAKATTVGTLYFREVPTRPRHLLAPGLGRLSCKPLGQSSDSQDLENRLRTAAFVDASKVILGEFSASSIKGPKEVSLPQALEALKQSPSLLLFDEGTPYDRFIAILDPLFVECSDAPCAHVRDLNPELEVQICHPL